MSCAHASRAGSFFQPEKCRIIISCEHAGNTVPAAYAALFKGSRGLLAGHRSYDPGALQLARTIAGALHAPLFYSTVTRLLVDVNRSAASRNLFSAITRQAAPAVKQRIVQRYHAPYRNAIELAVGKLIAQGHAVVHFSLHSFTPLLRGRKRNADIGLLYDPARLPEKMLCRELMRCLARADASLRVRCNYPYRGTADGMTSFLRKRHGARRYAGIEIEINQKHPLAGRGSWEQLRRTLTAALKECMKIEQETTDKKCSDKRER